MDDDIRIVLVEDSPTVRRYLANLIDETPDMRVIGEAKNGDEAVEMVEMLRPDVISMDINMPEVDGLQATRLIMSRTPTPIVVVSSLLDVDVALSLKAIEAGALAVVSKPPDRRNPTFPESQKQLLTTLRAMARVKVVSRRQYRKNLNQTTNSDHDIVKDSIRPELIVIGASTGGPSALIRLLRELPADLPVPIIIVQHIPNEFIGGLVKWLDSVTPLQVTLGQDDMFLEPGKIVIAPGTAHLTVKQKNGRLYTKLIAQNNQSRHIPSIDVLFESVAYAVGKKAIGIILTGMGDDGARGLLTIRKAGGYTIVQDEVSSTVFGMPRAAIELGGVQKVVPLENLTSQIKKLL